MDFDEAYRECMDIGNMEDKLDKAAEIQSDSLLSKDWEHYVKATLLVSECQEMLLDQTAANITLEEALKNSEITDYKQIISLIDALVRGLLKTEEYEKLRSLLERRENYLEAKRSYRTMQKFYLAVCYEGLGEIKKAIEALNEVEDTLSSANLTNKYLKLSMLYLSDGKPELAKVSLEKAAVFDPKTDNPLFYLAKSDLSLYEGDDIAAGEFYRKFFVISKNKYRYLDRFIRIALKQGNLEEAIDFDAKWREKVDTFYSKHARKTYYSTVLELYKKIGDFEKAGQLQEKLFELEGKKSPLSNLYESEERLFADAKQITIPADSRTILLQLMRSLASTGFFRDLDFVHVKENSYSIMHFSKGLLLEKELSPETALGTLIEKTMDCEEWHQVYSESMLETMDSYHTNVDNENNEMAICLRLEDGYYKKGTIVAYPVSLGSYEIANSILKIVKMIAEAKFRENEEYAETRNRELAYKEALEKAGYGFLRIEGDNVDIKDEKAKKIFGKNRDIINFDDFIRDAKTDKRLYLDDFMNKEKLCFKYNVNEKERKVEFITRTNGQAIDCLVKDVTEETEREEEKKIIASNGRYYSLPGLDMIARKENEKFIQRSYLVVNFQNMDIVYSLPEDGVLDKVIGKFKDTVYKSARNRLNDLFALSSRSFVLMLETNDKRMIERIARELREIDYSEILYPVLKINTTALIINRPTPFATIRRQLIEMSVSTSLEENVLYTSRQRTFSDELSASIQEAINKILAEGALVLEYHPIGRWQEKKIFWLKAEIDSNSLFGSREQLSQALVGFNKVREYQMAFCKRFIKDIKYFCKKKDMGTGFVYPVSKYLLERPDMVLAIAKEIAKAKFNPSMITFMIEGPFYEREHLTKIIEAITSEGFSFALSDWLLFASGNDIPTMKKAKFGVFTAEEFANTVSEWYHVCQQAFSHGVVFDHCDKPLKKSFLSENKIEYVMGEYYPAADIRQFAE